MQVGYCSELDFIVIFARHSFLERLYMPEISVRGIEMPESPIRKLAPLAVAAKNRGIKVYHLNIGQPDLPTPQVGLDALKNIDRTVLEYSPSQGYLSYREKLTGYYKKYGIDIAADDIIVTSGGSEAVLFAFMACQLYGVCYFGRCYYPNHRHYH